MSWMPITSNWAKREITAISKIDAIDEERLAEIKAELKAAGAKVIALSAVAVNMADTAPSLYYN